MTPILSIGIPAYNRPEWLKRSLESIIVGNHAELDEIEIIISDDSSDLECRRVTEEVLKKWNGNWKYVANNPRLGMAPNWNQAIHLASGKYMLILHDDDYLLPNAIPKIINSIRSLNQDKSVLLFGVQIVDQNEKLLKRQVFKKLEYLSPLLALKKLFSNSSFIRFPAIIISKKLFKEVGSFNTSIGGVADLDMWSRLFSEYGVWCIPSALSAYTVHSDALTMEMFNAYTVQELLKIFKQAENKFILNPRQIEACKSLFFYQFILAGTFRQMRRNNFAQATKTIRLFQLPQIKNLKPNLKWFPLRFVFSFILLLYNFFMLAKK
jgi:glycosyltransferase involved in cell wall biosynthesis